MNISYDSLPTLMAKVLNDVTILRDELDQIKSDKLRTRPTEHYTREEAEQILKVTRTTLYHWDKAGILRPTRIGNLLRYSKHDIDRLLQSRNNKTK